MQGSCRLTATLTLSFCLLLSGCLNLEPQPDNSRYHILDHQASKGAKIRQLIAGTPHIYISRVDLPEYLKGKKLVIRKTPTEITLSETDRWVEPIEDSLSRVLANHMLSQLPEQWSTAHHPERRTNSKGFEVYLRITRLEGNWEKEAVIEGYYHVHHVQSPDTLKKHSNFSFSLPWQNGETADLPALYSDLTNKLGDKLLDALAEVLGQ